MINVSVQKSILHKPYLVQLQDEVLVSDLIAEYLDGLEQYAYVVVNGQTVDSGQYGNTVVEDGDHVGLTLRPEADPGTWTAIGTWLKANWLATTALVAAAYAGYALSTIETPSDESSQERRKRIEGLRNEPRKYEPVPILLGKHRVTPDWAAQPYVETVGNNQYYNLLLSGGYAPQKLEDFRIGDTPIDQYEDVRVWYSGEYGGDEVESDAVTRYSSSYGTQLSGKWPNDVAQEVVNVEVEIAENPGTLPGYVTRTTGAETDEIKIDLSFPTGLIKISDNGKGNEIRARRHLQTRITEQTSGDQYYVAKVVEFNSNSSTRYGAYTGDVYRDTVTGNYYWVDYGYLNGGNVKDDNAAGYRRPRGNAISGLTTGRSGTFRVVQIPSAQIQFYDRSARVVGVNTTWSDNLNTFYGVMWTITAKTRDDFFESIKFNPGVEDQFDVSIRDGIGVYASGGNEYINNYVGLCRWDFLTTYRYINNNEFTKLIGADKAPKTVSDNPADPLVNTFRPVTIIVRIKATNQLSGMLDKFNYLGTSVVPSNWSSDWRDWQSQPLIETENPTDLYRWLLQGPMNANPLSNNKIALGNLLEWRDFCEDPFNEIALGTITEVDDSGPYGSTKVKSSNTTGVVEGQTYRVTVYHPTLGSKVVNALYENDYFNVGTLPAKVSYSIAVTVSQDNTFLFRTSGFLRERSTLLKELNKVAWTGRGEFSFVDGKYGVAIKREQDIPVQMFTPKNSWSFSSSRQFPEDTDGIKFEFPNEDQDYEEDEGVFLNPDKDPSVGGDASLQNGLYDSVELPYTTNPEIALTQARFGYFENRLQREVYTIETDIEGLKATRGDLVLLQNDVIEVGLGVGRVMDATGSTFYLEETIDLVAGNNYGISIRSTDLVSTGTARYGGGQEWTVLTGNNPIEGDLVVYGDAGIETLPCIVKSTDYGSDLSVKLTLVNYSDFLYQRDQTDIPAYNSNISTPRISYKRPAAPTITVPTNPADLANGTARVRFKASPREDSPVRMFSLEARSAIAPVEEILWEGEVTDVDESGGYGFRKIQVSNTSSAVEGESYNLIINNTYSTISLYENGYFNTGVIYAEVGQEVIVETNDPTEIPSEWTTIGIVEASEAYIDLDLGLDNYWELRGRALSENGLYSPYSNTEILIVPTGPAQDVTNLNLVEFVNTPKSADANLSTIAVTVDKPSDGKFAYAEIQYRKVGQFTYVNAGRIGSLYDNRVDIVVASDGSDYEVVATSVSISGVRSASDVRDTITVYDVENDPTKPEIVIPNVRGMEIFDQGNDNEFVGRDVEFNWRDTSINEWTPIGSEPGQGVDYGGLDLYFRDYEIKVFDMSDNLLSTYYREDSSFTYTYELNRQDYKRVNGSEGANRQFRIEVRIRGRNNQFSEKPARLTVSNPAPQLPALFPSVGFTHVSFNYTTPEDRDFTGIALWLDNQSGFTRTDDNLAHPLGADTSISIDELTTGTTYYVKYQAFDAFGEGPVSDEFNFTTNKVNSADLDDTPPSIPDNLTLTSGIEESSLATKSWVKAEWDVSTDDGIVTGYFVSYYTDVNPDPVEVFTGSNEYRITDATPGRTYYVKVKGQDWAGNTSDYSTEISITADGDTDAPAVPTGISATGGLDKVILKWTNPSDDDFLATRLHRGTTSGFTPTSGNLITTQPGRKGEVVEVVDANVVNETEYFYKVAAVDVTGNVSSVSSVVSATPEKIKTANVTDFMENSAIGSVQLADASVDTSKLSDLSVTAGKLANGSVDLQGNKITGQLQKVNLADAAVDSDKLADLSVEAAKLVDGAVTTTKIANLAVGTAAIANAAITNAKIGNLAVDTAQIASAAITSAKIEDLAVGNAAIANAAITNAKIGTAAITEAKIEDAAITTAKIDDLAVTNAKIDNIDAVKITAGTIDADRIGADSITASKIDVTELSAISADLGSITAGTVTGATVRTSASGARVEITSVDGIRGFNGSGNVTFQLDTDGSGSLGRANPITWNTSGTVTVPGTLIGGEIVGNTFKTAQTGWRVEMSSAYPMRYWDGTNTLFSLDSSGNAEFAGSITVGQVTGLGSLATEDSVGSGDVDFNYAGSSSKGGNASDTENVNGIGSEYIGGIKKTVPTSDITSDGWYRLYSFGGATGRGAGTLMIAYGGGAGGNPGKAVFNIDVDWGNNCQIDLVTRSRSMAGSLRGVRVVNDSASNTSYIDVELSSSSAQFSAVYEGDKSGQEGGAGVSEPNTYDPDVSGLTVARIDFQERPGAIKGYAISSQRGVNDFIENDAGDIYIRGNRTVDETNVPGADPTKTIIDGGLVTTGGLQLDGSNAFIRAGKTSYTDTTTGIWLGRVEDSPGVGTPKFNIGTSANYIDFNGSDLVLAVDRLGSGASNAGDNSVAIGGNSSASGDNSVAVGRTSRANNLHSVSIGYAAESLGGSSVAVGLSATAGSGGVAVGVGADATARFSTAVGQSSEATHERSSAFGIGATTTAADQIRLGTASETVSVPGDIDCEGTITQSSDERKKTNWQDLSEDFLDNLTNVKYGTFDRTDKELTQAGVSAQDWQKVLPEAVGEDAEGFLTMDYGASALVTCLELAKEIRVLKDKIAKLEGDS